MVSFHTRSTRFSINHYKALMRVQITHELSPITHYKLRNFIAKHIAEFGGRWEDDSPVPIMLFERSADASRFADELSRKLNIQRQHISVKAWK